MKKQPVLTANMAGGLNVSLDPTFLVDTDSPNLSCIWLDGGLVKKDTGRKAFGTGNLGGYAMFMDSFPMRDGSIHYLYATPTKLYKSLANGTYSDITAGNFTGNNTDRFSSCVTQDANGNDFYIITNGVDPIKCWTGTGNIANLGGLANTANTAKIVGTFKNRCILGFTTEGGAGQPTRVRWSALADPANWTDTANGAGFVELVDTPDWITGFLKYKERFIIFKERSIWELVYVGYPDIFKPATLMDGVGSLGPDFPMSLGDRIVFYGTDSVYAYDTYTLTPLADPVYPLFYYTDQKIVNIPRISQARACYVEELGEYWLSVPTVGDMPDTVFKLNIDTGKWTKRNQEVTAFGYYSLDTGTAWQDGVGTWANQSGPWMGVKATSGAPTTLMGDANGQIWEDDRLTPSNETMNYETKDFMWAHAQRIVEIRAQVRYGPFTMAYSSDGGATWEGEKSFAYVDDFTEFVLYCNITVKQLRVRIQSSANWCDIKWIEPWYIPRQRTTSLSDS